MRTAGIRWAPLLCAVAASGCGKQSTLDPHSHQSRVIEHLWWWMLAAAAVVFLGAAVLLMISWSRRHRTGLPVLGESDRASSGLVLVFGIGVPIVALIALFVVANLSVAKNTEAPKAGTTSMTVEVTGHQWFWQIRYPGTGAITANELHIPVGTRVELVAKTADVIHSFWVPQLNRKIDMVPGRTNRILLFADKPGRYRGQCAEFCGLQHAHMGLYVFAEPRSAFRAWVANMAKPRRTPASRSLRGGERVFMDNACASCHTIRGTAARGRIGPDLTHVASRSTLAATQIPNDDRALTRWVRDPQHVKPGNKMPALDLSGAEVKALTAYLESLR